jgi:DNA polymerase (family 10)
MRQLALVKGYSLSEWGLRGKDEGGKQRSQDDAFKIYSEKDLFAFFDLSEIPPELREGMGEIEAFTGAGVKGPRLVTVSELRGVFHNHTTASDGRASIEEMAAAAEALGWDYLGLADHSKASFQAKGLDDARVIQQLEAIRAFNESGESRVHIFAGIECDILVDGSLDLNDRTLESLDYAVMSVHSGFTQSEAEMTARVIRAVEHPATTMLGHPTGRLLLRREPYRIDLSKVIDACIANRVVIEINANPRRLDLDWRYWRRAADRGLMCAINPDAHSTDGLKYYEAGVNIARKGWLAPEQILNCRDAAGVRSWFDERRYEREATQPGDVDHLVRISAVGVYRPDYCWEGAP